MLTQENVQPLTAGIFYPSSYNPGQNSLGQPEKCSLIALFSTFWKVKLAQSDVSPPPWSMLLRKSALLACSFNFDRGKGKSKRKGFQRKSAGVPTLLSRIVDCDPQINSKCLPKRMGSHDRRHIRPKQPDCDPQVNIRCLPKRMQWLCSYNCRYFLPKQPDGSSGKYYLQCLPKRITV